MELFGSNIKQCLTVSQKKIFLIFQETELFYISGSRDPKLSLIFQEVTFQAQKVKQPTLEDFLIFREMELFSPKIKTPVL